MKDRYHVHVPIHPHACSISLVTFEPSDTTFLLFNFLPPITPMQQ